MRLYPGKWACALAAGLLAALLAQPAPADKASIAADPDLPDYEKVEGVAGNLNSVGSDTLLNLMTYWSESFKKQYPNVRIQIEGKGSGTAPPALIEGTAQLGPMSRFMKNTELDAFDEKYGFEPTPVGVAVDTVAVYVNKDNPLESISLPEVDAIFSKNRKGGYPTNIETWGDLGLEGVWSNLPVSIYGRNSASGTYGYFKSNALFKGDFKDTVKEQPGSAAVVLGVTEDKAGIGYSGIGYMTSGVRALPVSPEQEAPAHAPTMENAFNGNYPLARMLVVYVVKEPGKPLPTLTREFLKFVLSEEGQKVVVKDGYLPLPAEVAARERAKIEAE